MPMTRVDRGLRVGIGRIRPYRARRELSLPKHTVRPMASGPEEMMVGRSIFSASPIRARFAGVIKPKANILIVGN
jgi:hypothetical protein